MKMKTKIIDGKPEIEYPCLWQYKLISPEADITDLVNEIMADTTFKLKSSRRSSSGKYHSFNLEFMVENEETRNFYYNTFNNQKAIKMVI